LLSPEEKVGGHLKILAEISRLVKDKFMVERLKTATNGEQIIKIISTYEK